MHSFFGRLLSRVLIALVIIALLAFIMEGVLPLFINDVSMEQFENDNFAFIQKELVFKLQNLIGVLQGVVVAWVVGVTAFDFIKEYKEFKENKNV